MVEKPRGWWELDPDLGTKTWRGELFWEEAHGPAVVTVMTGSLERVDHCLLPDGTRGLACASLEVPKVVKGHPSVWRYERKDGTFEYGRIVIDEGRDVRFVSAPELAPVHTAPDPVEDAFLVDVEGDERLMGLLQDDAFAQEFYASLCNMDWVRRDGPGEWGCTWRAAGGVVAELRGRGEEYIDFYCSGNEGEVSGRVAVELERLGWYPQPLD